MTHPSSLDLEAFACGETLDRVSTHIDECLACHAFVERLRGALSAGPSRARAAETVARAAARSAEARDGAPVPASIEHARTPARARHADAAGASGRRKGRSSRFLEASTVAFPLAAAAVILLLLRTTPPKEVPNSDQSSLMSGGSSSTAMRILMDPETTFKGGIQIAVIRERAGQQARFTGPVAVKPGDRLRVEVALDREQDILAAVMADDGSWLELMAEAPRQPGTHFSERSARVDASPMRGTILVGSPKAIAHARSTRRFDGVAAIRVEWEAP